MSRFCFAAVLCGALGFSGDAPGAFVLLDGFDGYNTGELAPQSTFWETGSSTNLLVGADPADSGNQILVQQMSGDYSRFNDGSTLVPNGSLGTLFFRMHIPGTTHTGIALSPLAAATEWSHGKSILRVGDGGSNQDLFGRDGGTYRGLTNMTNPHTWYNVWAVVDNDAREAAYYLQSDYDADFATQTLISPALGDPGALKFRQNVSDGDLVSILLRSDTGGGGSLYLDDFHVDSTAVNLANPLPPRTFGTPVAVYREVFPNDSSDTDLPLSSADWNSHWGAGAQAVVRQEVAKASSATADALPINSNPENAGLSLGYLVTHPDDYNNNPVLHWTEEYSIDRSSWGMTSIEWHQRNSSSSDTTRVALRVGDDWFASEDSFSNAGAGAWELMHFDFLDAGWRELSFEASETLQLGGSTAFPSRGAITGFGLFVDNAVNTHRIDNFTVFAVPEPTSAVLLVVAGLCLALGRRRRRRR